MGRCPPESGDEQARAKRNRHLQPVSRGRRKRADYLLVHEVVPLAVIEAKRQLRKACMAAECEVVIPMPIGGAM